MLNWIVAGIGDIATRRVIPAILAEPRSRLHGLVTRDADARDCLVRQVTGAVRWVECMQLLLGQGATHFLEVGPGKVLTGLLRQIDRSAVGLHVDNAAALEKTLARLTEPHPPESHPEA